MYLLGRLRRALAAIVGGRRAHRPTRLPTAVVATLRESEFFYREQPTDSVGLMVHIDTSLFVIESRHRQPGGRRDFYVHYHDDVIVRARLAPEAMRAAILTLKTGRGAPMFTGFSELRRIAIATVQARRDELRAAYGAHEYRFSDPHRLAVYFEEHICIVVPYTLLL